MIKHFLKEGLLLLMVSMSMMTMAADIDYWTKGTAVTVLKGGATTPSAGMVYVSATAVADESEIAAEMGSYMADPVKLTGASGTAAVNKEWFFYAKANAGYKFIGFASSATGTPSGAGAVAGMTMVGSYYQYSAKSGAGWSSNTEATAKDVKRYAVFEKDESAPVVIDVEGLPRYTAYTATPAADSKVKSIRELTIAFTDPTYDEPFGLMPSYGKIEVNRIEGGSKTPVEVKSTASVKDGQLLITFEPAIADTMTVEIIIPEAMTNNVMAPIATMSKDELGKEGYCTNPEITLTYQIEPGLIKLLGVTNQTDSVSLLGTVLNSKDYTNNVNIIYLRYEDELTSCISPSNFPDYVTIYREEGEQHTPILLNKLVPMSEVLGVLKPDYELNKNVRDYHYLQLRLSSDNKIDTTTWEGRYVVNILPGLATNIDGQKTEGASFSFIYGKEVEATVIDIDTYLGEYEMQLEMGEHAPATGLQTFSFVKQGEAYYISRLMQSSLLLPVTGSGSLYYTENTEANGEYVSFEDTPTRVVFDPAAKKITLPAFRMKKDGGEEIHYSDAIYKWKREIPTGADAIPAAQPTTVKMIRNGQMLIVREGKVFTIEGTELR